MSVQNQIAQAFTALHKPGDPIVLLNAWDAVSAEAIAQLPDCKAVATPSAGIANARGIDDDDLTLEANLDAARIITKVCQKHSKPITIDVQDGYGSRLEECIKSITEMGAIGFNLEDFDSENQKMYSIEEASSRIQRARAAASAAGVPDVHINARCDTLLHGGTVEDAITRGKAYLEANASTVFVWGGPTRGGITRDEVAKLCRGVNGKLNVSMRIEPDNLTVRDLAAIGVARISIGPGLQRKASRHIAEEAEKAYKS